MSERTCNNTDRELWREPGEHGVVGDYFNDSIHVTEYNAVGINCGGKVVVQTLRDWFKYAELGRKLEPLLDPMREALRQQNDNKN